MNKNQVNNLDSQNVPGEKALFVFSPFDLSGIRGYFDSLLDVKIASAEANFAISSIDVTTKNRIIKACHYLRGAKPLRLDSIALSSEINSAINALISEATGVDGNVPVPHEIVNLNQADFDSVFTAQELRKLCKMLDSSQWPLET